MVHSLPLNVVQLAALGPLIVLVKIIHKLLLVRFPIHIISERIVQSSFYITTDFCWELNQIIKRNWDGHLTSSPMWTLPNIYQNWTLTGREREKESGEGEWVRGVLPYGLHTPIYRYRLPKDVKVPREQVPLLCGIDILCSPFLGRAVSTARTCLIPAQTQPWLT